MDGEWLSIPRGFQALDRYVVVHMALLLSVFCLFYFGALFPYAFFRHDDWLIVHNGTLLTGNWSSAWSPTLTHGAVERVWFFRPLFKFNGFLFWRLFGEQYYFWLIAVLFFVVAAVYLAAQSLTYFSATQKKAVTFVSLFVCAPLIHFGSLTWIGEGLMNGPQLFLLALSLWAFLKAVSLRTSIMTVQKALPYSLISLTAFTVSLGLKESSVFHTALLLAVMCDSRFGRHDRKQIVRVLFPYGVIAAIYLGVRLLLLPINSDYVMRTSWVHLGVPAVYFLIILGSPAFLIFLFGAFENEIKKSQPLQAIKEHFFYLVYFGISILPYLGQPFFSVGWPLLPGFFFLWLLATRTKPMLPAARTRVAFALLLVQIIPAGSYLNYLRWWEWKAPQRALLTITEAANGITVDKITVADCRVAPYLHLSFDRVVTHFSGLVSLWIVKTGRSVVVEGLACDDLTRYRAGENEIVLRWSFPDLQVLRAPLQLEAQLAELLIRPPGLPSRRSESLSPRPLNGSRFPSSSPPSP